MELFFMGVLIGLLLMFVLTRFERTSGILKIDQSDPEKDRYLFDVGDLDKLKKKRKIVLRIDPNADLSQD